MMRFNEIFFKSSNKNIFFRSSIIYKYKAVHISVNIELLIHIKLLDRKYSHAHKYITYLKNKKSVQ
jgi:hypothetical protein